MSEASWLDEAKAEIQSTSTKLQERQKHGQQQRADDEQQRKVDKQIADRIYSAYLEPAMVTAVKETDVAYGPYPTHEPLVQEPWLEMALDLRRDDFPSTGRFLIHAEAHSGDVKLICSLDVKDRQAPLAPMTNGQFEATNEDAIDEWIKSAIGAAIRQFSEAQL